MLKALIFALALSLLLIACSSEKPAESAKPAPAPAATPVSLPEQATAILDTTAGKMTCELFPKQAPETVRSFIGLAEGTKDWSMNGRKVHGIPLYSGVIFHRVIPGFMIQAGDPSGTGSGDVGFTLPDELVPSLKFDKPGRLAMANTLQPNTGSSQFFITETAQPNLDACYDLKGCMRGTRYVPKGYGFTIFGQCDAATVALVKKIARMPRDTSNDRPFQPVKINRITIERGEVPPAAPAPAKQAPAGKKP